MKCFLRKNAANILIALVALAIVSFVISLSLQHARVDRPDPGLQNEPYAVTVLERIKSDVNGDPTYYNVVKLQGVDVLYLKVYDLSDRYMVPYLKSDGTPMTYDDWKEGRT